MKVSSAPQEENPVIKTTTIRQVIPAKESEGKTPDYWEFTRNIPENQTGDYMTYLYRVEPTRLQIDHTTTKAFDVPGYGPVGIYDQEGLETIVSQDCGGGTYRLICKHRTSGEWKTQTMFKVDMPTKNSLVPWFVRRGENKPPEGTARVGWDGTTTIAGKAIDTIAGQQHEAVNIGLGLFREAAAHIRSGPDELTRQFMNAWLSRAMNPPPSPDPLDMMTKILALQAQLNPGNSGNPLVAKIIDMALSRISEPINPSPAVSMGAEMVRGIPSLATQVVEGIREWRMGMEAQRDGVSMMNQPAAARSTNPPPMPQPQVLPAHNFPSVNPTHMQPTVATRPTVQAPPPNGAIPPSTEFVEQRIVEVIRQPISADEAADDIMQFLYMLSGENATPNQSYVEQLASLGETGLMTLFQNRPMLRPGLANPTRLAEFIRAFLRKYAEDKAAEKEAAAKLN